MRPPDTPGDTGAMAERILMIDDDSRLAGMVCDYLGGAGFRVTVAGSGREGEALLTEKLGWAGRRRSS